MLRIGKPAAALTIALIAGAAVHLREPQSIDVQLARSAAWTICTGLPDEEFAVMFRAAIAQTLLQRCLQSWDGIGDADGNVIDVARDEHGNLTPQSRDALASLLTIPAVFDAVERDLLIPFYFRQADEKNGSSLSPSGTSAGALKGALGTEEVAPIAGAA